MQNCGEVFSAKTQTATCEPHEIAKRPGLKFILWTIPHQDISGSEQTL